jgi:hypothetical protein
MYAAKRAGRNRVAVAESGMRLYERGVVST